MKKEKKENKDQNEFWPLMYLTGIIDLSLINFIEQVQ
jgi:hypothetical protein